MASFLSRSPQFISTPKFTSTQSHSLPSPPSSVSFRQSQRVSASYSATAERPATVSHTFSPASSMYEVLGIDVFATSQEIKAAYRRLARVLHPDVAANKNDSSSAAGEFIKIHNAYATLSDPEKRAEYDRTLFRRERRVASVIRSSTSSGYSGYWTGQDWETDQCW